MLLVIKFYSCYPLHILDAASPLDLTLPELSLWPAALEVILDTTSG